MMQQNIKFKEKGLMLDLLYFAVSCGRFIWSLNVKEMTDTKYIIQFSFVSSS